MIERMIARHLIAVLNEYRKMAFVSGPRQVGKTTLAKEQQARYSQSIYFNWDSVMDQKRLLKDPYFFASADREPSQPLLVVLDEIHKYGRWKNYLKGAYDSLFRLSGFPEPFVRASQAFYNTWFQDRKTLLIRDDIRSASPIRELSLLEMLSHTIPDRVGAPLS